MFEGLRKKFSDAIKGFVKKEEKEAESIPEAAGEMPEKPRQEQHIHAHVPESKVEITDDKHVKVPEKREAKPHEKVRSREPREAVRESKPEKDEELLKLSLLTKIKKTILGSVVLSDGEVDGLLSKLKVSMLESDVTFDVAESFSEDLASRLKGKRIESRDINNEVTRSVRDSLLDALKNSAPPFKFVQLVREHKEKGTFVILFLGPNGTGKTTTIAKLANRLKREGVSIVIAASDTFRAAAIEQIEHHANKIGVPVIKSTYGADPASIAFDAIAYARAHKIDVVLIDSAGRQETNSSLIKEMEKMARVSKPNMTIFVGESTAGNAIANQIIEFNKHMPIQGIILTKLDCDAKGGTALSISRLTGIPILFFGVGEGYDALVDYDPNFIADAILPSAG